MENPRRRRCVARIAGTVLLQAMLSLSVPAAADVTVSALPQSASVSQGDPLAVEIWLDTEGTAVGGGGMFLAYDPDVVEFVDGTVDETTWNLGFVTTPPRAAVTGVVSFALGAQSGVIVTNAVVARLNFRAIAPGETEFSFLFNVGAEWTVFTLEDLSTEVSTGGVDGAVVVAASTPTPQPSPMTSPLPTATRAEALCSGDCTEDGTVTVDEILLLVGVALRGSGVDDCRLGDTNGDSDITVDEILAAVQHALSGCAADGHVVGPLNVVGQR